MRIRGYSQWSMAPPRLLLALAVAAFLPLVILCQEERTTLSLHSENFRLQSKFDAAVHPPQQRIFDESAESAALLPAPTELEVYPDCILLAGVVLLLAQSALIILLMLRMQKHRRSDQTVRRLTRRLIHAGEEERRHLARELHDDIGQRLSLVSVELGSLNLRRAESLQDVDQEFEGALEELQTVISDVHGLSHRLHSSKFEHLGLREALRELCQQIARRHDLQIDLQMDEIGANLDGEVSLCFYRVAQEALSNVVRHSSSSRAAVRFVTSKGTLSLLVMDDGAGFDPSKVPAGLGMVTMEERLRIVGGRLLVTSKPGEGTAVTAQVSMTLLKHQKGREANSYAKVASRQETLTDRQA
jgi:signal transduction histidine kinase